jgi:hypothetical protein
MKFTIDMDCGNAAFDDANRDFEVARILRKLADDLEDGRVNANGERKYLRDINGNFVGYARYED